MADYYPLVAKAIAGLEKNTGEGRRALYERARSALVAQLRGMNDPPLTEAEITRERLALDAQVVARQLPARLQRLSLQARVQVREALELAERCGAERDRSEARALLAALE